MKKTEVSQGEQRLDTIQDREMKETKLVSTSLQNIEMKDEGIVSLKQDEQAILKSNNFNSRATIARVSAQSTIDKSDDSVPSKT